MKRMNYTTRLHRFAPNRHEKYHINAYFKRMKSVKNAESKISHIANRPKTTAMMLHRLEYYRLVKQRQEALIERDAPIIAQYMQIIRQKAEEMNISEEDAYNHLMNADVNHAVAASTSKDNVINGVEWPRALLVACNTHAKFVSAFIADDFADVDYEINRAAEKVISSMASYIDDINNASPEFIELWESTDMDVAVRDHIRSLIAVK